MHIRLAGETALAASSHDVHPVVRILGEEVVQSLLGRIEPKPHDPVMPRRQIDSVLQAPERDAVDEEPKLGQDLGIGVLERAQDELRKATFLVERADPQELDQRAEIVEPVLHRRPGHGPPSLRLQGTDRLRLSRGLFPDHVSLVQDDPKPVHLLQRADGAVPDLLAAPVELARHDAVCGDDDVVLGQPGRITASVRSMIDVVRDGTRLDVGLDLLFPVGDRAERRYQKGRLRVENQRQLLGRSRRRRLRRSPDLRGTRGRRD